MAIKEKTIIEVGTTVNVPARQTWKFWSEPAHITQWNFATEDWKCPKAENDLRPGGKFSSRMEAKDGSFGFDFNGIYDKVEHCQLIEYTIEDGRKVSISFQENSGKTQVVERFEAESQNPTEMQKSGWQAILNNFKKYAESQSGK